MSSPSFQILSIPDTILTLTLNHLGGRTPKALSFRDDLLQDRTAWDLWNSATCSRLLSLFWFDGWFRIIVNVLHESVQSAIDARTKSLTTKYPHLFPDFPETFGNFSGLEWIGAQNWREQEDAVFMSMFNPAASIDDDTLQRMCREFRDSHTNFREWEKGLVDLQWIRPVSDTDLLQECSMSPHSWNLTKSVLDRTLLDNQRARLATLML